MEAAARNTAAETARRLEIAEARHGAERARLTTEKVGPGE